MAKNKPDAPENMDATVRRKLTEEQVAERGRQLAEKLGIVKGLREEKKEHADRLAKEIEERLDECEYLRLEILEGQEESRQGDLFAGPAEGNPEALPPVAAAGALAEVARRAEHPDEVPGPVKASAMAPAPGEADPEEPGDDKGNKAGGRKKGVH